MLGALSATVALARRFSVVYTGALTDVLDRHGHLQKTAPHELARRARACVYTGPLGLLPVDWAGSGAV